MCPHVKGEIVTELRHYKMWRIGSRAQSSGMVIVTSCVVVNVSASHFFIAMCATSSSAKCGIRVSEEWR